MKIPVLYMKEVRVRKRSYKTHDMPQYMHIHYEEPDMKQAKEHLEGLGLTEGQVKRNLDAIAIKQGLRKWVEHKIIQ